ncbi:hypothetical protein NSQ61_13145 [Aeribacillus sp. FSL K6-1121]|uniref:hypothetical protein n=1 Tax=Aeribacillus sp. FSL K6-1121 TaxID=2954745 RepID=UPI0030F94437
MTFKKWFMAVLLVLLCIGMFSFFAVDFRYGYKPKNEKVMPYVPNKFSGFDLWGKQIASEKSTNLIKLQNAANLNFRYNPKSGVKPSKFFQAVDPTPDVPGINQLVAPPQFPKVSLTAPDGLIVTNSANKITVLRLGKIRSSLLSQT